MLGRVRQPGQRPRRALRVGDLEDREAAHRVGALAVADRFDVGVLVRVDRGRDGDPAREVDLRGAGRLAVTPTGRLRADQGLRVGAGQLAQLLGEVRQLPARLHAVQQGLGAVGAGGEDDTAGLEGAALRRLPRVRGQGRDRVAALRVVRDRHDRRHRVDRRARLLGQVEVVLVQGVLRAVTAARHALAALGARLAGRARAAEVRVGHLLAGAGLRRSLGVLAVAEEDADGGHVEGVSYAHALRGGLQVDVRRGHRRVQAYAEHAAGLVVVRGQLLFPIGDVAPLGVLEERLRGDVEGVGVVQGAAAHARAGEDHDVAQEVDALEAVHVELGGPEVVLEVPGVFGERRGGEAAACLQHPYLVALFGQAQGSHRAAEA